MNESQRLRRTQSPIIPVIADLIRSSPGTISLGQGVVGTDPARCDLPVSSDFSLSR